MLKLPCERGLPGSKAMLGAADVAGGASSAAASVLCGPACSALLLRARQRSTLSSSQGLQGPKVSTLFRMVIT